MATNAILIARRSPRALLPDAAALLPYLLTALAAAGLGEQVFLRSLSRVGVHIPKEGVLLTAYDLLTRFGSLLFNLATVLAVLGVAAVLPLLLRSPSTHRWAAAWGLALLVAWSLTLPVLGAGESARMAFGLTFSAVVVLLALPYAVDKRAPVAQRLAVGLVAAAYVSGQYYALSYGAYRLAGSEGLPPLATQALGLGEVLVLLAAVGLYRGWGRWSAAPDYGPARLPAVLASAASLVLFAAYAGGGSTSAIVSLWTEGLTLYLPLPLYLTALWLFVYAATACLQRRSGLIAGCALVLLFVAGFSLELTYQHLLAALAVALLVAAPPAREASSSRSPSTATA